MSVSSHSFNNVADVNKWELIFDFTKDESGKKLNYGFVNPSDFKLVEIEVEGAKSAVIFPYPQRYGGTLPDDANAHNQKKDDGMMAFGFDVNQNQAQKIAEEKEAQAVVVDNDPYQQHHDEDEFDLFAAS